MKVRRLYIIGDFDPAYGDSPDTNPNASAKETTYACYGLYEKYLAKCEQIAFYGCRPIGHVGSSPGGGPGNYDGEVGAYVVFHSMGPSDTPFSAETLVDTILPKTLGEDDFAQLSRVVFVACTLAHKKGTIKDMVHGQNVETIEGYGATRGFILTALVNLGKKGIYPRVVGWDSFISVAPYMPEGDSLHAHPKYTGKTTIDPDTVKGRKIGHARRYGLVNQAYRDEHKRTFWIEGGKVFVDGAANW